MLNIKLATVNSQYRRCTVHSNF